MALSLITTWVGNEFSGAFQNNLVPIIDGGYDLMALFCYQDLVYHLGSGLDVLCWILSDGH